VIPGSVTSIGDYAFKDCKNLTIYADVEQSEASGWSSDWNSSRPVYWKGQWLYVDGVPTPNATQDE
jgi:hypothetical protein